MSKTSKLVIVPLMITFFTMGFVDLVGIASNYVKADFGLSDTLSNLLPSMVFLWFLLLAVPTGMLMSRIGRKNTVLLSLLVTLPALILPLVSYNFPVMLVSFCFLGIGNTLMQVSLNPLVANIVNLSKMESVVTFGQFVKAISSFIAPVLAALAVTQVEDWRMLMFPTFAIVNVIVLLMLYFTKVSDNDEDSATKKTPTSFKQCFSLLGDGVILLMFLGIMAHVGLDVGINTTAPRILEQNLGMALSEAGFATSWYFIFRTAGCFLGAYILSKFAASKVFWVSILMILAGTLMLFVANQQVIYAGIALFGLGNSNIFSVMFSQALKRQPEQNDAVSGLMITGVCGGAVIPPIMGLATDVMNSQSGAIIVLIVCVAYLITLVAPKIKA